MEMIADVTPEKTLLLYSNKDSIVVPLKSALFNILKLRSVERVNSEKDMETTLINENFLGGIIWKVNAGEYFEYTDITIRFPSALRTIPTDLWNTNHVRGDGNTPRPLYMNEGFLQIMYAIVAFLAYPAVSNITKRYKDDGITIVSKPFLSDKEYNEYFDPQILDPMGTTLANVLPFYLSSLYIYPFVRLVMHMQKEKNNQLNDLMSISSANRITQYLSWFTSTLILATVINLLTIFLLTAPICKNGNILNCSSFTAVWCFFTIWTVCGICLCFLIHSLLRSATLAAIVIVFLSVLCFLLYIYVDVPRIVVRYPLCLLYQFGFLTGLRKILYYEKYDNTGLQWYHFLRGNFYNSFAVISIIMLMAAFTFLVLCLTVELCCPGKYGVSILRFRSNRDALSCQQNFQRNFRHLSPAVVQACILHKSQHRKPPLTNFAMNMYDDQITVILGLSDSGKSAVINAISGSIPPRSGWVKIDDRDIARTTRTAVGLSPQHNPLFANLSVKENMYFFYSLRNVSAHVRTRSTERYLKALELWQVRNVKSRCLDRADRRRLSVACAFCGNPRIVVLDEPSEGLEPCERRLLWDLLQSEKRCRTLIVTTYHIEEADVLGDRLAILCDGQLLFNGTSTFLKNTHGSGYQLVCSQGEICEEPQITSLVLQYIPETSASSDKPSEIAYSIPQDYCRNIVPLLRQLEQGANCFKMGAIGIGTMPIINKFVKATSPGSDTNRGNFASSSPEPDESLLYGYKLCCNQWNAMLLKKFYHIRHNFLVFFMLLSLLLLGASALQRYFYTWPIPVKYLPQSGADFVSQDLLPLRLEMYGPNCRVAFLRDLNDENPLIHLLKMKISGCRTDDISATDVDTYADILNDVYVFGIKINMCEYQIYYSRKFLHSEAVAASLMAYLANSGFLGLFCTEPNRPMESLTKNINFNHHPYPSIQLSENSTVRQIECFESGPLYLNLFCVSIFSGFFAAYIVRERRIGFKLMQQVEGINMTTFWLSHLFWDWMCLSIFSVSLVILMTLLLHKNFDDETVAYVIGMILFSCALLLFLYLLMQFFTREIYGWATPVLLLFVLAIPFEWPAPDKEFAFLYLIPTYSAIALMHSICIEASSYKVCKGRTDKLYAGCEIHSHWCCTYAGFPYIMALMGTSMLFYILLLLLERGSFCKRRPRRRTGGEYPDYCDVQRMTQNELRNHTLLLENVVTKNKRSPVKDVTFGLKPMDVLGLVGERSGKTSINKVIVSNIKLSSGRVLVKGVDVHSKKINRYRAYKYMGYCPQNDCFEPKFTGRENLKIFCLIRGLRADKVHEVSEELAENLNFREHLDKQSWKYTVSDRRKLSTAISVIGTPPLIILDEPTAGVEKAHRADVLDVIKSVNECGSTILLSSNNVEDFQSLCNRMALLKRGKVIGIGSVESFRNSLTPGLILMVKVRPHAIIQSVR
ncbi:blast:ATP-binding cassette sub-family A member 3 [Drosophila guanche]|uniref:Blast:ATP-binding cassette sub-family A member 3 n=1 Tax=Drosophila guanche TaxID=7266 RepID=A0A3B0JVF7_DROGU|nr:blast:ATP-binding cassette sub-family A member 3 [Drosophila guanche]